MAASKVKPLPAFKQPKFPVYEALYKVNLAFESLLAQIATLADSDAVQPETLKLYRVTAEELRSAMNNRLVSVLLYREDKDWGYFGKQLLKAREKLTKSSN